MNNSESPRINYDNPFHGTMSIFLIILNEEWHISMYDYMRNLGYESFVFWVLVITTGEVLIMKLFLALFINK